MDYGPGDAERYQRRLRKQRRYQRTRRDGQAEEGVPERDDVAKVVLAVMLDRCIREPDSVDTFIDVLAHRLTQERKRFDKAHSAEVVRNIIERHREAKEREARKRRAEKGREA